MEKVEVLVGREERFTPPLKIFHPKIIDFLDRISKVIEQNKKEMDPDCLAFGFWCRRANVEAMRNRQADRDCRSGRGKVLHIAPSNVPSMFAYSLVVGLLAGNANIVRLPSKSNEVTDALVSIFDAVLREDDFSFLRPYCVIIRYQHEDAITKAFMDRCDCRVLWGGDNTIQKMRSFPLRPLSTELVFPDRSAISLINLAAFHDLDQPDRSHVIRRFYRDTYGIDQNACSSPSLVLWAREGLKEEAADHLINDFWDGLGQVAQANYPLDAYRMMRKWERMTLSLMSEEGLSVRPRPDAFLSVVDVPKPQAVGQGGFGLFYQAILSSWKEMIPWIRPRMQTLTILGYSGREIAQALQNEGICGIDRIVPIGSALDFDSRWDGMDMIARLSRLRVYF